MLLAFHFDENVELLLLIQHTLDNKFSIYNNLKEIIYISNNKTNTPILSISLFPDVTQFNSVEKIELKS